MPSFRMLYRLPKTSLAYWKQVLDVMIPTLRSVPGRMTLIGSVSASAVSAFTRSSTR